MAEIDRVDRWKGPEISVELAPIFGIDGGINSFTGRRPGVPGLIAPKSLLYFVINCAPV